jgi:hypothetical protein
MSLFVGPNLIIFLIEAIKFRRKSLYPRKLFANTSSLLDFPDVETWENVLVNEHILFTNLKSLADLVKSKGIGQIFFN